MKTLKHIFQLRLSAKEVVWSKKILAIVMLPIFLFYMTSMNFLVLGMMRASAEEAVVVEEAPDPAPKAEEPKVEEPKKEEAPAKEPTVVEEVVEPVVEEPVAPVVEDVVNPPATEEITPLAVTEEPLVETVESTVVEEVVETPAITDPAPTEQATEGVITPETASIEVPEETPVPEADIWSIDGNKATTNNLVEKDVKYIAPQNEEVSVTFTEINGEHGTLSIEEITLTDEQVIEFGALSNKAYDITSTMENGTFAYNLTLPKVNNEASGISYIEKSADELDTVAPEEIQVIDESQIDFTSDTVEATAVNHFTIVYVSKNTASATTTLTITKPSSVVSGSFLIAGITFNGGSNMTVTSSGWTSIRKTTNGTDVGMETFYKVAGGSEPSNYSWTINNGSSSSTERASGGIINYSGVDTNNPIDVSSTNTGNSSSVLASAVTTTVVNDMVVAFFGIGTNASFSQANGTTERYDVTNSDNSGPGSAADEFTKTNAGSTGDKTSTVTHSGNSVSDNWVAQQIALRMVSSDITAPTITNISSDKTNGSYKAGEVIDIDVTFSEAVTSTGNVTVTLETGTTDRTCTFAVTNATTGTCNYTVQAGDTSADLTVASISGTIKDAASNSMTNFVPATNLAANKALVIDTTAPTATVVYDKTNPTNTDVVATATASEAVTYTSAGSTNIHTFASNGTFLFEFVDAAGNTGSATATVSNIDKTIPVITLVGNAEVTVIEDAPYVDAGATALDNVDGDIYDHIVTVNPVDISTIGDYTITYNVSDAAGNAAASVSRVVHVVPNLTTISLDLEADGIQNNLDTCAANPANCSNLYFEKPGVGKITFPGSLDLTGDKTQETLQALFSGGISFAPGSISFDAIDGDAFMGGATLEMSGVTCNPFPTILVDGKVVTAADVDPLSVECNSGILTFHVEHFSEYSVAPTCSSGVLNGDGASDAVQLVLTCSNLDHFASSGLTTTTDAADLNKIKWDSADHHVPSSATISGNELTLTLSAGDGTFSQDVEIDAGTLANISDVPNDAIPILAASIHDDAKPKVWVYYFLNNPELNPPFTTPIIVLANQPGGFNIGFQSTEGGNLTYSGGCTSLSSKGWGATGSTLTFGGDDNFPDGVYDECTITLTDSSGNFGTGDIPDFIVDTTGPVTGDVTITPLYRDIVAGVNYISALSTISAPVTDDGVGVNPATCQWLFDGNNSGTSSATEYVGGKCVFTNAVTSTATSIKVRAIWDDLGADSHQGEFSSAVLVSVDNTAPTASITSPADGSLLKGIVTITADAADIGGSGVERVEFWYASFETKIGDGTYDSGDDEYSINWDTTQPGVGDGSHSIWVKAYDNVGNVKTSSYVSVTVDNEPPVITIAGLNPTYVEYGDTYIDEGATATEGETVIADYSSVNTFVLGEYTVTYDATDEAGNHAQEIRTVNVVEREIEVTADPDQSKVYGESDPALTYTITSGSLVGADDFTGTLDREDGEDVDVYAIGQGTLSAGSNYAIDYIGDTFNITPASSTTTVTCTAGPFTYNGEAQTPCTVSVTGAGGLSLTPTADYSANVDAGTATASYTYAGDANHEGSSDSKTFAISKADANISVTGGTFTYDNTQHAATGFAYGIGGISDVLSLDIGLYYEGTGGYASYTAPTNAGTYSVLADFIGNDNYNTAINTTTVTIDRASSTTTVTCSGDQTYTGSAIETCSATVTGAGGLDESVAVTYSADNTNVGVVIASANFTGDANHNGSSDSTTFEITKSELEITADNQTKEYAAADPIFTFQYSGFLNGETSSVIDTSPICTVSVVHDNLGTYAIVCASGDDNNYDFNYTNGVLEIVDTTDPTLSANPPGDNYDTDQLVELIGDDLGSGVDSVYYTIDGSDPSDHHNLGRSLFSADINVDHDMTIKAIAYDNSGNASDLMTEVYEIAPVISAQTSSSATTTSITINWTTDEEATSRVVYGTTPVSDATVATFSDGSNYGYANSTVEADDLLKVTEHSVVIDGLIVGTTYYYRTISHGSPETVSVENSFTTLSLATTHHHNNNNHNNNNGGGNNNATANATVASAGTTGGTTLGEETAQGEETAATSGEEDFIQDRGSINYGTEENNGTSKVLGEQSQTDNTVQSGTQSIWGKWWFWLIILGVFSFPIWLLFRNRPTE